MEMVETKENGSQRTLLECLSSIVENTAAGAGDEKTFNPDVYEEAKELAHGFDFSGGQIENIVRKKEIKFIIDGVDAGMEEIRDYCREELIEDASSVRKKIGFR